MITTRASLIRALKGAKSVTVSDHRYAELAGVREIVKAGSSRLCLALPKDHPRYDPNEGSWIDLDKAETVEAGPDGSILIYVPRFLHHDIVNGPSVRREREYLCTFSRID